MLPRGFADEWAWRNPLPQGNDLLSATYGLGKYLAAGKNGALIASSDGALWTSQPREGLSDVQTMGFGQGLFIALSDRRGIFSSENGADWVQRFADARGSNLNRPPTGRRGRWDD